MPIRGNTETRETQRAPLHVWREKHQKGFVKCTEAGTQQKSAHLGHLGGILDPGASVGAAQAVERAAAAAGPLSSRFPEIVCVCQGYACKLLSGALLYGLHPWSPGVTRVVWVHWRLL